MSANSDFKDQPSGVEVRKIRQTELLLLLQLYKHLHPTEDQFLNSSIQKAWTKIIQNDFFNCFVIEQNGFLVASCMLIIIPNLTRQGRSIAVVENVVTHSQYRNKGLGRKIMETAINYARNENCYKIMLLSNSQRTGAHQFYESLGFSADDKVGYVLKINDKA